MSAFYRRVYDIVACIPSGRVVTYGQIARALEMPWAARTVGWAMRACPPGLPWHRVVNQRGGSSLPEEYAAEQRQRLAAEGVHFTEGGWINLDRYRWDIEPLGAG